LIQCEPAHPGPRLRIGGQQRRLRVLLLEILRMASDWKSLTSPSIRVGTTICGLIERYASANWSPFSRCRKLSSRAMSFRFSVVSGFERRFPRSLIEFQDCFATEDACAEYFFERRWPEGFVCPSCGGGRAWLLKTKAFTYECADCGRQTSVTAGTIMHASKLPLTVWFWAAFLMATHSNGISALQLQNRLALGSYRTAWMLCAKLRRAMVNPERQPLSGLVEADETIIPFRTKNDPIVVPAGRSRVGKMLVAGAVGIDGGKPRRARLKVIEGFGKPELHSFVLAAVAPQTRLVTTTGPLIGIFPMCSTTRSPSARWRRTSHCPGSAGCFQTSSAGAWASTTDCARPTCSTTSTSSCSASTGAGRGTPPSKPCSASAPAPLRRPTTD
jgi:hypothetical protein